MAQDDATPADSSTSASSNRSSVGSEQVAQGERCGGRFSAGRGAGGGLVLPKDPENSPNCGSARLPIQNSEFRILRQTSTFKP